MKITFFSTNSSFYSEGSTVIKELPTVENLWASFLKNYPEIDLSFVIQKPGRFLLDNGKPSSVIKTVIINEDAKIEEIAEKIIEEKPDLAVSVTYWQAPYDWLSIKDSSIAEILKSKGIQVASHPVKTSKICFSKSRTRDFLKYETFNFPKGVYIHHELYWAERNHPEISRNVYKDYILSKIKKLKAPYVIKDTTGLSSYGMDVCKTYNEVVHILNSKKTNGDRIVEEFISGPSFGIEIYGSNNRYTLSPLFVNSVNQFGLTSPKQNVKLGPVFNNKFRIYDLFRDMERISSLLKLNGICQIDLIFHDEKWYITEINSRISGLTETAAVSMNLTLPELLVYSAMLGKLDFEKTETFKQIQGKLDRSFVMNMKFPLLSDEKLKKLKSLPFVVKANQIQNLEAKQIREEGYAEVIFGKTENLELLLKELEELKIDFPDDMEMTFYDNAISLSKTIS